MLSYLFYQNEGANSISVLHKTKTNNNTLMVKTLTVVLLIADKKS